MSTETVNKDFVLFFGKYKGKTLEQVASINPKYITWLDEEGILKIEESFLYFVYDLYMPPECDATEIDIY